MFFVVIWHTLRLYPWQPWTTEFIHLLTCRPLKLIILHCFPVPVPQFTLHVFLRTYFNGPFRLSFSKCLKGNNHLGRKVDCYTLYKGQKHAILSPKFKIFLPTPLWFSFSRCMMFYVKKKNMSTWALFDTFQSASEMHPCSKITSLGPLQDSLTICAGILIDWMLAPILLPFGHHRDFYKKTHRNPT